MNSNNLRQDSHSSSFENCRYNNKPILTTVTKCLTEHTLCSKVYVDYSYKFYILCSCYCHSHASTSGSNINHIPDKEQDKQYGDLH